MTGLFAVLAIGPGAGADKKPDNAARQIAALAKDYQSKSKAFWDAYHRAQTEEQRRKVYEEKFPQPARYATRFFALAEDNPQSPAAVEALSWVVALSPGSVGQKGSDAQQALGLMRRKYLKSDQIGLAVQKLGGASDALSLGFLRQVLAENPHRAVQGKAAFALAQSEKALVPLVEGLTRSKDKKVADFYQKQLGKKMYGELIAKSPAEWAEDSAELFQRVADRYADLPTEVDGKETTLGKEAKRYLFVLRDLKVGRPVPNAALRNLTGKRFNLKDLRGKVFVLDFWATWCQPCRTMIPHERELVKRLQGKPFVLISISADNTRSDLTDFLEKQPMPWTHCFNGRTGGILAKWMIDYFPAVYVVDAKGVIRYKDVRGKRLDEAVDTLLSEAGKGK
jgi:thiol-disulfide isomerase/thioredoxin